MLKKQDFYDEKYKSGEEILRSSKIYAIEEVPDYGPLDILDIGCGSGVNSELIADLGHNVYGIDISKEAIKKYHKRGFCGSVMDVEKSLGFNDASFDIIFSSELIEHLTNPDQLLSEIYSVLRPDGKIIITTPNSAFWVYRIAALFGFTISELQHPLHYKFYSKRSLMRLLEGNGFRSLSIKGRNIYLILPDPRSGFARKLLSLLRFKMEKRFVTDKYFWHLSNKSSFLNSFFSDTFIVTGRK